MAEARIERRLAAILAADVAGYSRLMGADEEGTLAALQTLRKSLFDPKIFEYRGRIVKTTGDGALVEFASAVDAVRCAVDVQRTILAHNMELPADKWIQLRIGINVGDIIVQDDDIFGDGVNIAARLETTAEPGGLCISEDAHRQIRGKVEMTFEDMGLQTLKNIAEPLRVWRMRSAAASDRLASSRPRESRSRPDKPSIAVLPFTNMSNDPEQEYLADGMTEDTITLLSQTRDFVVIARGSTVAYKGQPVDIPDIGRQLGVRYVLEGSVRRAGNRIRVTAQLVEVKSLDRVWADHFDRDLTDLFSLQDEVTSGIVGALHPQLISAEAQSYQRQPPSSLDAWGLAARSMMALVSLTKENLDTAIDLATQAIEIAPDYGLAYGIKAFAQGYQSYTQWGQDWYEDAKQASANIKRALVLQGDDPTTLFLVGGASHFMARHRTGVALLERAIQLNPNLAMAHGLLGISYASIDRPAEGLSHIETALRLSPRDPMTYIFFTAQALCKFVAGDYPGALSSAERSISIHPSSDNHLYMAAALAELDELDKAREQIKRALMVSPKMNLVVIGRGVQGNPGWERYHAALRKAGLPEQTPR
jgi:adenylate cyclase